MGIEDLVLSNTLVEEEFEEDREDVIDRMRWFIDKIKLEIYNNSCGIFSHSYAIKYFLNSLVKNPDREVLPHAGVVLLDYTNSKPIITDYDSNKHLKGIESY
jgi:broad specificity phosphatase PhoE